MKKRIRALLIVFTLILMFGCSVLDTNNSLNKHNSTETTNSRSAVVPRMDPSRTPPGGIPVEQTPMFVSFGWDDNGYSGLPGSGGAGGMTWILDFLENKVNPGTKTPGNSTFNGDPVRHSFYMTTKYANEWTYEAPAYVKKSWNKAYTSGHEIGNHTDRHDNDAYRSFSVEQITTAISTCHDFLIQPYNPSEQTWPVELTSGIGVPYDQLIGFRNPHLAYNNNTFTVLNNLGYKYDCSIAEGFSYLDDGTNYYWPYTLHNGSPGNDALGGPFVGSHPGLWELPVYALIIPPDDKCLQYGIQPGLRAKAGRPNGKITSFDHNLWATSKMTKEEFLATLKYSFDIRAAGNRAPFMFGSHTDLYSDKKPNHDFVTTAAQRREAIEEFINYVLTKDYVRMVPFNKILEWVENPAPLNSSTTTQKVDITITSGIGGTVSPNGKLNVLKGSTLDLTTTPQPGYSIDKITYNGSVVTSSTPIIINTPGDIHVTFKENTIGKFDHSFSYSSTWGTGFNANLVLTNNTSSTITSWEIVLTFPGNVNVTSVWAETAVISGNKVTLTPPTAWTRSVAPGQSITIGMGGNYSGEIVPPTISFK